MKALPFFEIQTLQGHSFLPELLSSDSTVVDLGANLGNFSAAVRSGLGCRCLAVEANPNLVVGQLRETFGVDAVWCAIADRDGEVEFELANDPEASRVVNHRTPVGGPRVWVPSRCLASLLHQHGIAHVDLLKVDIEGAEIAMFKSSPDSLLKRIDQITIEFHDHCGLVSQGEIDDVRNRLVPLGFYAVRSGSHHNDWLFVRRSAVAEPRQSHIDHLLRPARNVLKWLSDRPNR